MTRRPSNRSYALVLESPNRLELRELREPPNVGDDEALIESMFVAICGTDLEVIEGTSDRAKPPVILGHEWAGRVAAVGVAADPRLVGAFVVGENAVDGREVGFELPGAFASHFVVSARNLRPLPDSLQVAEACLIEPLAVGVRAVRAGGLKATDSVLVIGDGVIGMFIAGVASLATEQVTIVGRHGERLQAARELGTPHTCLEAEFISAPRQEAWSVLFEATGKSSGLSIALGAAAPGGRVVLAGDYGRAATPLEVTTIVRKELSVVGTNASAGAWDEAVRLASTRAIDLCKVSPLVMAFDRWPEAFEAARARRAPRVVLRHRSAEIEA